MPPTTNPPQDPYIGGDPLGMLATDNEEDCVMHFWAGFLLGVFVMGISGAVLIFL
jgi:hypothetical protein